MYRDNAHSSINLPDGKAFDLSTYRSINLPIYQYLNRPINLPFYQPAPLSNYQFTNLHPANLRPYQCTIFRKADLPRPIDIRTDGTFTGQLTDSVGRKVDW